MERLISFSTRRKLSNSVIERLKSFDNGRNESEILEDSIKNRFEVEYAIATNNSTSALHLAMCAMDLKRGDKVLCSVNSFVDIPEVVRHFDAEPIFVDIDTKTYNMDLNSLETKLKKHKTKKLRAVIINHMAGLPLDMERVRELADKYSIKIVEDCSDSFGAKYSDGSEVGTKYSDLAVVNLGDRFINSFNAGALISNSNEYASRAKLLKNHSIINQSLSASYLYDVVDIGCDYRMSDYDAILAQDIFDTVDSRNRRKREIADIYFQELRGLKHITLPVESSEHIYSHFIIEIDKNRDGFARELKERGVEVALHYVPLHMTKYYKEKYSLKIFDFSNAMNTYQRVMSLPNHTDLSNDDVMYICKQIKEVDNIHI